MNLLKSLTHLFHSGLKPNALGAISFVALLFFTFYFSNQRYRATLAQEDFAAYALVNEAKNNLQEVFTYSVSTTELFSFLVREYDVVTNFDSFAAKIFEHQKYIDAVQLVPDGVICCVYPLEGNESVIGYNILEDETRNKEAFEAINRRQLYFAGPLELRQGGIAVIGRLPIFRNDSFWGFSAVIIKLSTLLNAAGIDSVAHDGFLFHLSKINPNSGEEEFFLNERLNGRQAYSSQVTIPSGEWRISVTRIDQSHAVKETLPIFVFGLLLSFTGAAFIREMSRAPHALGQRLDESKKNYRQIFENTSEGIYRSTVEGKLLLANPSFASMFGYSSVEMAVEAMNDIGKQMYAMPEERDKIIGELLTRGSVTKFELQGKTKSGNLIWISVNAHLVYGVNKSIEYIEGTVSDVTARRNDRDKLNEQFEVLMKYAYINSHEVRAHVATLLGLVGLINKEYVSENEVTRVINLINDEAVALDKVIRGLSELINKVDDY